MAKDKKSPGGSPETSKLPGVNNDKVISSDPQLIWETSSIPSNKERIKIPKSIRK